MSKPLGILCLLLALPLTLAAQMSRDNANRIVDLRVTLGFEDGSRFGSHPMGQNAASDAGSDGDTGSTGRSRETSSNFQIRVQLQDAFGVTLEESSPNGEGTVVFKVRNGSEFRVRVFGPEIEEAFVERVDPAFGGSMLSVTLRRKGQPAIVKATSSTVAAVRLNVPPKAVKELEKGARALAARSFPEAQRSFEKAIEIYPNYDMAYNNLGVTLIEQGNVQGARQAFAKAATLNASFARAFINLAKLDLAQKDYASAQAFLSKALTSDPLNAQAVFLSAQAHFFSDQLDEVIADVKKLHSLPHAEYGLGHYLAGKAHASKGSSNEAIQELQLFITEDPKDPNHAAAQELVARLQKQP